MKNIAIFGMDGAGKSTLARAIRETHPEYKICPMAESLRIAIAKAGLATLEELWAKPTTPRIRSLLINFAKDERAANPDKWITEWVKLNSKRFTGIDQLAIVDDTRYINEFQYFKSRGFLTVYLDAPIDPALYQVAEYYQELPIIGTRCDLLYTSKESTPQRIAKSVLSLSNHI